MLPSQLALMSVPMARSWVEQTLRAINALSMHPAVSRYFFLHAAPPAARGTLDNLYRRIDQVLGRAESVFRNGDWNVARLTMTAVRRGSIDRFMGAGTVAYNNEPRDQYIYFNPSYMHCGPLTRVYVLVHEAAHHLHSTIVHRRINPPQAFDEATLDADAFSDCAFEVATGRPAATRTDAT